MSLQYIAGFFDGEGTVSFGLGTTNTKNGRHWYPTIKCIIANTNKEIIEEIHRKLKLGTIQTQNRNSYTDGLNREPCFFFVVSSPIQVISFIEKILPFSKVKKERLELAKKAVLFIMKYSPRNLAKASILWKNSTRKRWEKTKVKEYQEEFIDKHKTMKGVSDGRGRKKIYQVDWDSWD